MKFCTNNEAWWKCKRKPHAWLNEKAAGEQKMKMELQGRSFRQSTESRTKRNIGDGLWDTDWWSEIGGRRIFAEIYHRSSQPEWTEPFAEARGCGRLLISQSIKGNSHNSREWYPYIRHPGYSCVSVLFPIQSQQNLRFLEFVRRTFCRFNILSSFFSAVLGYRCKMLSSLFNFESLI
jgi:hypothetical protein